MLYCFRLLYRYFWSLYRSRFNAISRISVNINIFLYLFTLTVVISIYSQDRRLDHNTQDIFRNNLTLLRSQTCFINTYIHIAMSYISDALKYKYNIITLLWLCCLTLHLFNVYFSYTKYITIHS